MKNDKRKSVEENASSISPKKKKVTEQSINITEGKLGKAAPGKDKGKFQKKKDGSFQKRDGGIQKKDGGFQKEDGGSQKKAGGFQKKGSGFQKKDGGFPKNKSGFQKTKDGKFLKNKDGKFVKGKEAPTEKPVWSEMKKQKKELRLERRKNKATVPIFELSFKAKSLSSQIQRKTMKETVRQKLCAELHILLKGQYTSIALTHDLSRVIQVLLKNSDENIRNELSEELLPIIVQMIQSKYAHHSVKRILKYGNDAIREKAIEGLLGSIVSLATHTVSAPVLDFAYAEHATAKQKLFMQQEFYGDIFKKSKDINVKSLKDAYKNSPEMKEAILSSCKSNIQRVLDKNLHDGELLHAVLYHYLCECSAEERAELVTTLSPLIVPLSNSLPGADAACLCVWQGTNKDKKTILKVVKEHAVALSTHKTGYRLLLAVFDSVDDTVLVRKTIISSLSKSLKDIAKDHWGKMTLHWLVKPTDTAAFHPALVKQLKAGAASGSSKKNAEARVSELHEGFLPPLYDELKSDPEFWLSDPTIALLTAAILSTGPPKEVMSAIVGVICRTDWTVKTKTKSKILAVEDAGMHTCLKKMAQNDKDTKTASFGEALAEELTDETLKLWLPTNRGCFLLLNIIENNPEETVKKIKTKIMPLTKLITKTSKGGQLLMQSMG